jgi:predicted nuclease of restriction endonuclease-like RecB superfamily
MADISAWLEPIGVEATTFSDSAMVTKSLVALYVHIIGFWTKAYTAYSSSKSRKLFGALKAIWTDYDDEFRTLQQSVDNDLKIFLASANAEHHRQFNQFDKKFDKCMSRPSPKHETQLITVSGP